MESSPSTEVLSVPEAAALLGKAPTTIRLWCRTGRLPATKLGRSWRIDAAGLRQTVGEASQPSATATEGMPPVVLALALLERQLAAKDDLIAQQAHEVARLRETLGMWQERARNLEERVKLLTAGPQPKEWWRRLLRR